MRIWKVFLVWILVLLPVTSFAWFPTAPPSSVASGVTNGDTHDHSGGDGAQIDHTGLANVGTNTHAQIDTFISGAVGLNGTINADEITVFYDGTTLKALTESEFKAAYNMQAGTDYESPGAVSAHTAESDPHTGYMLESNVGTGAGNYIQLNGSAQLPPVDGSQLTGLAGGGDINGVLDVASGSVAALIQASTAFTSTDTTPSASGHSFFRTANASSTTISDFDDPTDGQIIYIFVNDDNTTFDFTSSGLEGLAADFAAVNGSVYAFYYDATDTQWHWMGLPAQIPVDVVLTATTAKTTNGLLHWITTTKELAVGDGGTGTLYYRYAGQTQQTGASTSLPANCTTGDIYIDTDADTNGSLYICVATDTWKLDDDDGTGGVAISGTPAQYQWSEWVDSNTIKGTTVSGSSVACTDANGSPTACSNLSDTMSTLRTNLGLGTVYQYNVGTGANNIPQLSGTPGTPDGTKFLRDDGTWVTPAGSGDVTAALSFGVDNVLVKSDGTGKGVQATGISVDDTNNMSGVGTFSAGAAGFTVDADGDAVAKSISITKQSGVAGLSFVYEADTTSTLYVGMMGPLDISESFSHQYPNAQPAGSFYLWGTPAGTGDPNGNKVSAATVITPGTGVTDALQVNVGSAGAPVLYNGALGTPSGGSAANLTEITANVTTSGDQTRTVGQLGLKTDEDLLVTHGGANGEVVDEVGISLLQTLVVRFDPEVEYDNITNHTIDLLELRDEAPHGITMTEWKIEYVKGDPTTEIDMDLMCDTTPDWNPAAGGTVMDVLDTTAGTATADSGFDSATCANGANLYLRFGADPVDSGETVRVKIQYYLNED